MSKISSWFVSSAKRLIGKLSPNNLYCKQNYCSLDVIKRNICTLSKQLAVQQREINTTDTRLALDCVKRTRGSRAWMLLAAKLPQVRTQFDICAKRLEGIFFPASSSKTVIEQVHTLFCRTCNLAFSHHEYAIVKRYCFAVLDLSTNEKRHFDDCKTLLRTKLYLVGLNFCAQGKEDDAMRIYCALFCRQNKVCNEDALTSCGKKLGKVSSFSQQSSIQATIFDDKDPLVNFEQRDNLCISKQTYISSLFNLSPLWQSYKIADDGIWYFSNQFGLSVGKRVSFEQTKEIHSYFLHNEYNRARKVRLFVRLDCPFALWEAYKNKQSIVLDGQGVKVGICLRGAFCDFEGKCDYKTGENCSAVGVEYVLNLPPKSKVNFHLYFCYAHTAAHLQDILNEVFCLGQENVYRKFDLQPCDEGEIYGQCGNVAGSQDARQEKQQHNDSQYSNSENQEEGQEGADEIDKDQWGQGSEQGQNNIVDTIEEGKSFFDRQLDGKEEGIEKICNNVSNLNYFLPLPNNELSGTLLFGTRLSHLLYKESSCSLSQNCATLPYGEMVYLYCNRRFVCLNLCSATVQGDITLYEYGDKNILATLSIDRGEKKLFTVKVSPENIQCAIVFCIKTDGNHRWFLCDDGISVCDLQISLSGSWYVAHSKNFDGTSGHFLPQWEMDFRQSLTKGKFLRAKNDKIDWQKLLLKECDSLTLARVFCGKTQFALDCCVHNFLPDNIFNGADECKMFCNLLNEMAQKLCCRLYLPDSFSFALCFYYNREMVSFFCEKFVKNNFTYSYLSSKGELCTLSNTYFYLCAASEYAFVTGDGTLFTSEKSLFDTFLLGQEDECVCKENKANSHWTQAQTKDKCYKDKCHRSEKENDSIGTAEDVCSNDCKDNIVERLFCLKRIVSFVDNPLPYVCCYEKLLKRVSFKQYSILFLTNSLNAELSRQFCLENNLSGAEDILKLCKKTGIERAWGYLCIINFIYGVSVKKSILTVCPQSTLPLSSLSLNFSGKNIEINYQKSASRYTKLNNVTVNEGICLCDEQKKNIVLTVGY